MSGEKKLPNINFFICSTYTDLKNYREAVIKKIYSQSGAINAQESFGARDQKPLETCLEEVRKSNVFILIIGMKYGSVEKGVNKSFVELEYEEANKLGLPIFVYVIDENYPIPSINVERGPNAQKLDKFKKLVTDTFTVDKFTTPDDLSEKVLKDLIRELPKKGYAINESAIKLIEKAVNLNDLILRFKTLPKIYYGKEFSIKVKLGSFERLSKKECEAFSVTYGASIKREIMPVDKEIDSLLGYDLKAVYAQFELAQKLIGYDLNVEVNIKVRTSQGVHRTKTPIYTERRNTFLTSSVFINGSDMVISGYETSEELIIGLELSEMLDE